MEDFLEDIIHKAQVGLRLTNAVLAKKSEISLEELEKLKEGEFLEDPTLKVAKTLNLHGPSLAVSGKKSWSPKYQEIQGLKRFTTLYGSMEVNNYLIFDPKTQEAAIFDTGADTTDLFEWIIENKVHPTHLFLTHSHSDHIACIKEITKEFPQIETWIHKNEPITGAKTFSEGQSYALGKLNIQTRLTPGHSPGGTTYVIKGLEKNVAMVGDALFSGSIGGAPFAYKQAIEQIIKNILSLPGKTILCPGHGPMSTVAEERAHNPFFPEFKE